MNVTYKKPATPTFKLAELAPGTLFIMASDDFVSAVQNENVFILSENQKDRNRSKIVSIGNGQLTERDSDWSVIKVNATLVVHGEVE